ncbi:MAG: TldD/PmbA family protein [Acidimicrobiia bacterium]
MKDQQELLAIARKVAEAARSGEEVEAYVSASQGTDVRVYDGDVEHLVAAGSEGIGVRVVVDHRQGFAWAGSLDPDVIESTLQDARDNAQFAEPDEWQGVTRPDEVEGVAVPELDLWREDLLAVATDAKVAFALELEAVTKAGDPRVKLVEAAEYGDGAGAAAIANSLGVEAVARRTVASCTASIIASEGEDQQTGYGFSVGRTFTDLEPLKASSDAIMRATRLLGARQTASRRIPVVFDPMVSASLISLVAAACNGESVLKGRTMFADRLGERVAAEMVTLVDDPTIADAYGAATHDSEGVPTRRTELVIDGVCNTFLQNVYTGRRSGRGTTGSGVRGIGSTPGVGSRALTLAPGAQTPQELRSSVPEALYVQSLSGLHSGTNIVSGDFSVGATGLMVRNGEFAEPVREVTIASTLPRMLLDVLAVGSDVTWLPGGAAGVTLLVDGMTLSGS